MPALRSSRVPLQETRDGLHAWKESEPRADFDLCENPFLP
jgi:hypothetical protein